MPLQLPFFERKFADLRWNDKYAVKCGAARESKEVKFPGVARRWKGDVVGYHPGHGLTSRYLHTCN
jgi:hypothetical protein